MLMSANSDLAERRRYSWTVRLMGAAYVAALVGANLAFARFAPTGPGAYALAVLPALPIIGVFAGIGRYLVGMKDEYQRLLFVRQLLIATGFALSVATAWGFVESFDLAPHVPAYYAAVLWFGGLGLGRCVNLVLERNGSPA